MNSFTTLVCSFLFAACLHISGEKNEQVFSAATDHPPVDTVLHTRSIHIHVALCDNKYQGIVPVPARIGNGQDPAGNLYWGAAYGVRSFFAKSREWLLVRSENPDTVRLERLVFRHISGDHYLVADAYDGRFIRQCTMDFLSASAGNLKDTVQVDGKIIGTGGNAALLIYAGHNGLMDFQLNESYRNTDGLRRDVIILACYSRRYFSEYLRDAHINPLVWTTGLMAPEAYTLHDAIAGYVNNESNELIRAAAAKAYARYQKCSIKAAGNLLVTGW